MTNRGMATVADIASTIRDAYYGGDMPREAACRLISSLVCEFLEDEDPKLRRLKAYAFTYAYMEPDTEC